MYRRLHRPLLAATLLAVSPALFAEAAYCHYSYGGETKKLIVSPEGDPYRAPAHKVGSFFRFRVVVEREPEAMAALKAYVYEQRDSGPVLIQQASYAWPVVEAPGQRYGFTGLQRVYEPLYGGEFEYWCSVDDGAEEAR